jgi:hypothetical protein
MNLPISEYEEPARYRATLAREAHRRGYGPDLTDADLDHLADVAEQSRPFLPETREAVRLALRPVRWEDGGQQIASAVFDALAQSYPLMVVDERGRRFLLAPIPLEDPA